MRQHPERLAYDDADSTAQMHADAAAVAQRMNLADATSDAAPSRLLEDRGTLNPPVAISDAAVRLAQRMHLHLD